MQLSLITNDFELAKLAEDAGIERILIDLERLGKSTRQRGRHLFLSDHYLEDIPRMRQVLRQSRLMVRVDPLHADSTRQIDFVIRSGTDYVMLPYFHRLEEARHFLSLVQGRANGVLLVETKEAAAIVQDLCQLPGLAEMHIGLNDLSISLGKSFLFDLIADGTVDRLCATLRTSGIPFGFGGIGSLSRQDLPIDPRLILAEQVCQGATRGWLGRTFREVPPSLLEREVQMLRQAIVFWHTADGEAKEHMRRNLLQQLRAVSKKRE